MTIDEAIECERNHRLYPEYHEQIADWLEELKANRIALEKANGYLEANYRLGYSKGIDDFITKISESNKGHWRPTQYEHGEVVSETMSYDIGTIKKIAEQLKVGNNNG